jgi:hypothetical protein
MVGDDVTCECLGVYRSQWIRFMQNIRRYKDTHKRWPWLANAFKYALAQSVVMFSYGNPNLSKGGDHPRHMAPVQVVWILLFVTSTLYTYYWDVANDWGLWRPKDGWLRAVLMLPHRWMYFGAMVVDFLLRFAWMYQLVPQSLLPPWSRSSSVYYNDIIVTIVAVLELCRRFMWAIIRCVAFKLLVWFLHAFRWCFPRPVSVND